MAPARCSPSLELEESPAQRTAELSPRTFCSFRRELSSLRRDGLTSPGLGVHGAEVLELHDRSVVALPQTSMALPPLFGQRHHRSTISRLLRPGTQPSAAPFGLSRTDA